MCLQYFNSSFCMLNIFFPLIRRRSSGCRAHHVTTRTHTHTCDRSRMRASTQYERIVPLYVYGQPLFDSSMKAKRSASSLRKNVIRKICKILWYAFRLCLFGVVYSPYRTPIEFRKWRNWTNLIARARSMASTRGYPKFNGGAFKWKIRFSRTKFYSAYGCAMASPWHECRLIF